MVNAGVDVWIDRNEIDPLDNFPDRIREGLAHSHALLAWYSPEYVESSYCQKELTAAWICSQGLTRDVASRIFVLNPETGVAHIALGDIGRQNYLDAPKDWTSASVCIEAICQKLSVLSGDFASLRQFKMPEWHPFPRQGSTRFTGRLRELWRIHTGLNPVGISDHENPHVMVQLTGLGGIGKSLLATEYAKRFGAAYPGGIHWLRAYGFDSDKPMDAEARERERQGQIEHLALRHGLPVRDKDFREIERDLGRKLGGGEAYLWIVDDLPVSLDQEQGFIGWSAPSSNGRTLITTRSQEYAGLGVTVEVDVLEPAPALTLLTQERKPQTEQEWRDAEGLTEDLGRHALALDVAGHLLLRTKSFAALRDKVIRNDSDPLGDLVGDLIGQLPGGHEKSIVTTLLSSVRLLGQEGLNALRLSCELHGPTPIPRRLAKVAFGSAFALSEQDAERYVTRAVNQLEIHSLATVFMGGVIANAFSVHALTRYTMRHGDPFKDQALKLRESASAIEINGSYLLQAKLVVCGKRARF
ncbi:MAG: TIR domain-containing protein [Burkholderiales bacterium]|nr:TIR domain-containing protein [Burkholderiales bacterium]